MVISNLCMFLTLYHLNVEIALSSNLFIDNEVKKI